MLVSLILKILTPLIWRRLVETLEKIGDQKIAMLYGYAMDVKTWGNENRAVNMTLMMGRIVADIRTIGRIRKSIRDEQGDSLLLARNVNQRNEK